MRRDPLLHPAFLVALAGLWLNDHVFKAAHPGVVTGKLSDFCGLFMLPIVVHTLARRVGVRSVVLTDAVALLGAVWFALANCWAPAQHAFELAFGTLRWLPGAALALIGQHGLPALHAVSLTRDPTDLIALCVLGPAFALARPSPGALRYSAHSQ